MKNPIPAAVQATLLAAAAATCLPAGAQSPLAPPVVTIVRVPKPWYAPQMLVVSKMRDSMAEYAKIPGLTYKVYTLAQADKRYGGIYLWQSRQSAEAWFNPNWFARVEKERGAPGEVRTFEALKALDHTPGGTPVDERSAAVAALITVPAVAGADADAAMERVATLRSTLGTAASGLLREMWVTGHGGVGLVLLWRNPEAGTPHLNEAWHARVARAVGAPPLVEWYYAPILLPSTMPTNGLSTRWTGSER
jgi:hypothetical protein